MPVETVPGFDYFSQTIDLPNLANNQELFLQGIPTEGNLRLLPKYEEMLKQKLSKISVTIKFKEQGWNSTTYTVYKNNQRIGELFFYVTMGNFIFRVHTDYLGETAPTSSSNPNAIALKPVGKILDEFEQELNRMIPGERIRPAIENKASINTLKDRTGNPDIARTIGTMSGIVPKVKGVDIGQGRKRKTRKHRSRKHKKTRKH